MKHPEHRAHGEGREPAAAAPGGRAGTAAAALSGSLRQRTQARQIQGVFGLERPQLLQAAKPSAPPVQRVINDDTQSLDPHLAVASSQPTAEGVRHLGRYAAQDAPAYVGTGLAHTDNLDTCTALALHSHSTGMSLLAHVSTETSPQQLESDLWRFIEALNEAVAALNNDVVLPTDHPLAHILSEPDDVEIVLYTPPGHGSRSPQIALDALASVDAALVARAVRREQATLGEQTLYQVNKETRIVVGRNPDLSDGAGPGGARTVLPTNQLVGAYARQYLAQPTHAAAADLLILLRGQDATVLGQTPPEDYRASLSTGLSQYGEVAEVLAQAQEQSAQEQDPVHAELLSELKAVLGMR